MLLNVLFRFDPLPEGQDGNYVRPLRCSCVGGWRVGGGVMRRRMLVDHAPPSRTPLQGLPRLGSREPPRPLGGRAHHDVVAVRTPRVPHAARRACGVAGERDDTCALTTSLTPPPPPCRSSACRSAFCSRPSPCMRPRPGRACLRRTSSGSWTRRRRRTTTSSTGCRGGALQQSTHRRRGSEWGGSTPTPQTHQAYAGASA